MRTRVISAVVICSAILSGALIAQGQSQGRGRGAGGTGSGSRGGDPTAVTSVAVAFAFTPDDRVAFRDYFVAHRIVAQPLPPGIAKNVARGKALPPGIAKKALPADLVRKLGPRVQPGVTLAIVGDVIVAHRAGLVIDVMVGVFK